MALRRAIIDFAADIPFASVPKKIKEHYGVEVPTSCVQRITLKLAQSLHLEQALPVKPIGKAVALLEAQTDGGMIPIRQAKKEQNNQSIEAHQKKDGRKNKELLWKECKLTMVKEPSAVTQYFVSTLGDADTCGNQMVKLVESLKLSAMGELHVVGDGAPWIPAQYDKHFGARAHYLIDLYHVCEYLSSAAKICDPKNPDDWMKEAKVELMNNKASAVIAKLRHFAEPGHLPPLSRPVGVCQSYLENRIHQLDYAGALAKGRSVGSGKIESAHRYIVQNRIKRPGCWWTIKNAEAMINLRVMRNNERWNDYWAAETAQ